MSSLAVEFVVSGLAAVGHAPSQLSDPSSLVDAPGPVRAGVAFLLTVVFGGATLYRFGGGLDEAVAASSERPLLSVLYGVMAYAFVFFVVGYAYSQLRRVVAVSGAVSSLLVAVLAVLVLILVGYGFAVTGAWLAQSAGLSDTWTAFVGLAALCAAVFLVAPLSVGVVVWGAVAALGLGGPARRWVHASEPRPNAD